jgi:competence protein ComEC
MDRNVAAESLSYGDELFFRAVLRPISPPLNEGEFDYARYLFRKGVVCRGYLSGTQWEKTGATRGNPLLRLAAACHGRIFVLLSGSDLDADAKGLVAAMLLGDDALLDPERSTAYSTAGVSHVLCVSGMHVGILYMMLNYLFFFMDRTRRLRRLKVLLHLMVIWGYACVVALSPSVVRAAVMFTFVSLGGLFRQETRVYNSLLSAAFLMLLLKPLLLFETGFQLSYLAVWGIVRVQPALQRIWTPRSRVLRYIWNLWCVSIGAQLFTTPVSVHCFHHFPTWFLLSNVVVVTCAPLLIGAALLYLVLSSLPLLSGWMAVAVGFLARLMNGCVGMVGGIPGADAGPFRLDGMQVALLYALLLCSLLCLKKKSARWCCMALGVLSLLAGDGLWHAWRDRSCRELAVHAIPHHWVVEYGDARRSVVFADDPAACYKGSYSYYMEGSRLKHGRGRLWCAEEDSLSDTWARYGGYFQFGSISFLYLDSRLCQDPEGVSELSPDYLLVGDSLRAEPSAVLSVVRPGCVCIPPGFSVYRTGQWRNACMIYGIPLEEMGKTGMIRLSVDG